MTKRMARWAGLAGAGAAAVVMLTACGDDSTATAPITNEPVTTTSMYSSSANASGTASSSSTTQQAPQGTDASKPGMPATQPNKATTQPTNFPGAPTEPVSAKGQKYLDALKAMNVSFMGDTDNTVALTMARYICDQRAKNGDINTWRAFVLASTSPGTNSVGEANAKADKVIKAAVENYC